MAVIKKEILLKNINGRIRSFIRDLIVFVNNNDLIVPDLKIRYLGFEVSLTFKKLEDTAKTKGG